MLNDFKQNFIKNIFKEACSAKESARSKVENYYKDLEIKFDKTVSRLVWHVAGTRERLITTPLGDVVISRRIYRLKNNPSVSKILFDEYANLESRKTFLSEMDHFIVSKIPSVKSYKKLSEILGFDISPSTISRKVSSYKFSFTPKELTKSTKTVFVNMDGIWVNNHKTKRKEMKCVVAFTGTHLKNGRKVLENRAILPYQDNISSEEMAIRIEAWLEKIYGEIEEKIVIGDGANWITNVAKNMSAKRYIDQFHFKKWIKDLVGRKTKVDWSKILNLSTKQLVTYIYKLLSDENGVIEISDSQKELLSKIKRFFESFKEASKSKCISCIEGIQSHYVASHFKNRRSFSKPNTYKIMLLNLIDVNDWKLSEQGMSSETFYDGDTIDILSLRTSSYSNVPYLDSGSREMVKHLNTLIHI